MRSIFGTEQSYRCSKKIFAVLAGRAGIDLAAVPATAPALRQLLEDLHPARLGISSKRLANVKSLVTRAVDRFGMRRVRVTRDIALAPEWQALLAGIPRRQYVWGLNRLACYCSVKGIAPEDVGTEALIGLEAALEGDCTSGNHAAF